MLCISPDNFPLLDEDIKHILNNFNIYPKWMYYNEYIMILLLFLKKWNETHSKKVFFYSGFVAGMGAGASWGLQHQNTQSHKEKITKHTKRTQQKPKPTKKT